MMGEQIDVIFMGKRIEVEPRFAVQLVLAVVYQIGTTAVTIEIFVGDASFALAKTFNDSIFGQFIHDVIWWIVEYKGNKKMPIFEKKREKMKFL